MRFTYAVLQEKTIASPVDKTIVVRTGDFLSGKIMSSLCWKKKKNVCWDFAKSSALNLRKRARDLNEKIINDLLDNITLLPTMCPTSVRKRDELNLLQQVLQ